MFTFTETLPATKSCPHAAITWTPDLSRVGCGVLRIDSARCSCRYHVFPVGTGWDGKAFEMVKADAGSDAEADTYHIFCHRGRQDNLCDCKGFSRHGRCKHVAAAFALIGNGWDELWPVNPDADFANTECPF